MERSAQAPDGRTVKRWNVVIPSTAEKVLSKIDKPVRLRIIELIDSLETGDPRTKGKGLTANQSGKWRYRVGDYRVIADIEDSILTITVVKIGHRSKVYD